MYISLKEGGGEEENGDWRLEVVCAILTHACILILIWRVSQKLHFKLLQYMFNEDMTFVNPWLRMFI